MIFLRSLLFAALLFLSSCAQKAEIPEVEYVLAAKWAVFV
jgi:hypothetical protein